MLLVCPLNAIKHFSQLDDSIRANTRPVSESPIQVISKMRMTCSILRIGSVTPTIVQDCLQLIKSFPGNIGVNIEANACNLLPGSGWHDLRFAMANFKPLIQDDGIDENAESGQRLLRFEFT